MIAIPDWVFFILGMFLMANAIAGWCCARINDLEP